MTVYSREELLYWKKNKDWYGFTDDGDYYIKEDAPKEAKDSFEKFIKTNTD